MNVKFSKDVPVYLVLGVKDFERAKQFYTDVFGFEIKWDGGNEVGWCELELPAKGARLGLDLQHEGDVKAGTTVITFNVENLEETKEYLEKKGVNTTEIRDIPNMVSLFDATDTEGNKISFVGQPRVKDQ